MGKHKIQRTEALHQAARRYVLAKQAEQAIAQHNLDKLVRSGVIMTEPTTSHRGHYGDCAAYPALNLGIKGKSMLNLEDGGQGKAGGGRL